jgi:DNA-binding LytR/AlgR family response regulator
MKSLISILIVEDDVWIAHDIEDILQEVGYEIIFKAKDYDTAKSIIDTTLIDMVLLDINLIGERTGIDLANYIRLNRNIPFIYITSSNDSETILNLRQTRPSAFLVKPFSKIDLLTNLDIAVFNYFSNLDFNDSKLIVNEEENERNIIKADYIVLKHNSVFYKVSFDEIIWMKSDKNYVEVYTNARTYIVRNSLKNVIFGLPDFLLKCHRQYVVNLKKVTTFNTNFIFIDELQIPISRTEQEMVVERMKLINND